ncbi:MAG: hypothetical protein KDA61_18895 [Planctomycetales bacterium]|nr:hypothetical protein [Planctomycetales bacterium]
MNWNDVQGEMSGDRNPDAWEQCERGVIERMAAHKIAVRRMQNLSRAIGVVTASVVIAGVAVWANSHDPLGLQRRNHDAEFVAAPAVGERVPMTCVECRQGLGTFIAALKDEQWEASAAADDVEIRDRVKEHLKQCTKCRDKFKKKCSSKDLNDPECSNSGDCSEDRRIGRCKKSCVPCDASAETPPLLPTMPL